MNGSTTTDDISDGTSDVADAVAVVVSCSSPFGGSWTEHPQWRAVVGRSRRTEAALTSQEVVLRFATVCALVLAATFAVSCSTSPEKLTAPQLVARANAICLAAGHPYSGQRPTQPAAFLDFLRSQIPAQEKGLKALEALRPPAAAQQAWSKQVLVPEREQLTDARAAVAKLQDLLRRRDEIAASALVLRTTDRLDARGTGINRYWMATGMGSCLDSPL